MKSEGPRSLELRPRPQQAPRSQSLVVHIHGGGFVAQTSKSHEPYLKSWAQELGTPILSIDYSLAPEAPFPRALEECFYAYCWAVKHCALLGEPQPLTAPTLTPTAAPACCSAHPTLHGEWAVGAPASVLPPCLPAPTSYHPPTPATSSSSSCPTAPQTLHLNRFPLHILLPTSSPDTPPHPHFPSPL